MLFLKLHEKYVITLLVLNQSLIAAFFGFLFHICGERTSGIAECAL